MKQNMIILALFGLISAVFGQELPQVIPPSPDAASLAKFGDIPVSTYTGIPSVSIPVYTIQSKDITLPISLDYHASGIKVSEDASSVGLGWTLKAGGAITRSIMGRDDFVQTGFPGYLHGDAPEVTIAPYDYTQSSYNIISTENGLVSWGDIEQPDLQPDQYIYNFPGGSGAFTLRKDRTPFFRQKADMTIESPLNGIDGLVAPNIPKTIRKYDPWTIKTEDGYTYIFGSSDQMTAIEQTFTINPDQTTFALQGGTSWFLTKIISPKGEVMDFTYEEVVITTGPFRIESGSITKQFGDACYDQTDVGGGSQLGNFVEPNTGGYRYRTWVLNKIEYATGSVTFEYDKSTDPSLPTTTRLDLNGGKRLSDIKVFTNNTLTHHFQLEAQEDMMRQRFKNMVN